MNKSIIALIAALITGAFLAVVIALVVFFIKYPFSIVVIVVIGFAVGIFKSTYRELLESFKEWVGMFIRYAIKDGYKYYRSGYSNPSFTYELNNAKLFTYRKNAKSRLKALGKGEIIRVNVNLKEL